MRRHSLAVCFLALATACSSSPDSSARRTGPSDLPTSEPASTSEATTATPTTSATASAVPSSSASPLPALKRGPGGAPLPQKRTEVAGALWLGRIAVVGGLLANGGTSARVDLYDPLTDSWSRAPDLPVRRHHVGAAAFGDRLFIVGGYGGSADANDFVAVRTVFSLGPGETAWRTEPALAVPRGALGLAATGDRLVAFGGADAGTALRSVELLASGGAAWERGPDLQAAREHLGGTAVGDRVFAIGGRVGGLDGNLDSVESLAPGEAFWRAEPRLVRPHGGTAASTLLGRPCVAGGEEPKRTISTVECLDGGKWQRPLGLRVPRHGLAVVAFGPVLHVIAGGPKPGLHVSDEHETFRAA